jgi:menaquinone-dependent protoporphyrinogen oxidase
MRALVAYATQYGATREIAAQIAQTLTDNGIDASLKPADDAISTDGFDAFVVGSAIHAGHWLKPAAQFVKRHEAVLAKHPVWLFSSGPVGDGADKPQPDPKDVTKLLAEITVRGHVVFGGAFDRTSTADGGWLERTVGRFIPEGDHRDWAEIEAWARDIARQLKAGEPVLSR